MGLTHAAGVLSALTIALVAVLTWTEWRREAAASREVRYWKQVAQQWTDYSSKLRKQDRELRKQLADLRYQIDDSFSQQEPELRENHPPKERGQNAQRYKTVAGSTNNSHFDSTPSTVDYVFMWVDGNNAQVQAAMEEALRQKAIIRKPHIKRVRDDGTFEFALRSVLRARQLEAVIRNVYIVTSGELPSWLLPWLGDVPSGVWSSRFTREPLYAPLQPLVDECQGVKSRPGQVRNRSLYLFPHRAFFPDAARELPTFNSNAILTALHRLPDLSRW